MDKKLFFVLKFEHIFKKKVNVFVIFPWYILFGKTHETQNNLLCLKDLTSRRKLEFKRRF